MNQPSRLRSTHRPRVLFGGLALIAWAIAAPGCGGPKIPPEELGEVLTELPKLPEAERPYERPELVADGLDVPAAKAQVSSADGEPRSDEPEPESDATTADAPQSNPPESTSPDDPK